MWNDEGASHWVVYMPIDGAVPMEVEGQELQFLDISSWKFSMSLMTYQCLHMRSAKHPIGCITTCFDNCSDENSKSFGASWYTPIHHTSSLPPADLVQLQCKLGPQTPWSFSFLPLSCWAEVAKTWKPIPQNSGTAASVISELGRPQATGLVLAFFT